MTIKKRETPKDWMNKKRFKSGIFCERKQNYKN